VFRDEPLNHIGMKHLVEIAGLRQVRFARVVIQPYDEESATSIAKRDARPNHLGRTFRRAWINPRFDLDLEAFTCVVSKRVDVRLFGRHVRILSRC